MGGGSQQSQDIQIEGLDNEALKVKEFSFCQNTINASGSLRLSTQPRDADMIPKHKPVISQAL